MGAFFAELNKIITIMPRATGSIKYIEHRTPMKDESGEYLIHPMFVHNDIYDFKDMRNGMRQHNQMSPTQFLAAMEAVKNETMTALWQGMEVKVGDMFIIRPKLKLVDHQDENGKVWHKVYHEGDRIPANEVALEGFEVRVTKEFEREFRCNYHVGCSHHPYKGSMPAKEQSQELLDITNYCRKHGYITVRNLMDLHGVTKYHAQKVLNDYCEGEFPKMTREKEGRLYIYRRIGV